MNAPTLPEKFRLLRPEEVISLFKEIEEILSPAFDMGDGEASPSDVLKMVISGQAFVFASNTFVCACEFCIYPSRVTLNISYGAGEIDKSEKPHVNEVLTKFAVAGGADAIRMLCKSPVMARYQKMWFDLEPCYTMLEKNLYDPV